ncbi:AcrR family transcriptional regulator [Mycolicibacterium sp. BK556]|uniref:TetR/AcrR family transcriptional regulator n=1 Tax=Mycobacteriaceae TaxID=1762 RepID=UPI00105E4C4A|nr:MULTISPECIES: TetR/AcrR family transcriptional regulator [Mycobacteriaceae]MBB3600951.1 AcrR family transcriptional regulator [Mycolicibacterium sp. BK556]MBB3630705.1 AcrR family transcriptional regulator [Mycolicibacterium sp. BK607]TDO15110.1 TetR family transcriptional regulator [Mycobacterium sp. BK086]
MTSPRDRMVASAALLIRERGAQSTAIADVLAHSGAPRGSAYHYFPGGRTQLVCEAVDYVADFVAARLAKATNSVEMLDGLTRFYRKNLIETDYRAGCPVLAVAIESGEPDKENPAIERAAEAFTRWNGLIAARLMADGIAKDRAEDLAVSVTAALEGAIVLARAARDVKPLDAVHRLMRDLLEAECGT